MVEAPNDRMSGRALATRPMLIGVFFSPACVRFLLSSRSALALAPPRRRSERIRKRAGTTAEGLQRRAHSAWRATPQTLRRTRAGRAVRFARRCWAAAWRRCQRQRRCRTRRALRQRRLVPRGRPRAGASASRQQLLRLRRAAAPGSRVCACARVRARQSPDRRSVFLIEPLRAS